MTRLRPASGPPSIPALAGWLQTIAFVAILACAVARCFVAEMPFRVSPLGPAVLAGAGGETPITVDRTELGRATFATALLGAAALWALGCALKRQLTIRHPPLGLLILAFAAASLLSATCASDKRNALLVSIEQVSLLAAGFVMVQLCGDRRRFALVVIVLAGLGMAMATKGLEQSLWTGGEARLAAFRTYGPGAPGGLISPVARPGSPEAKMFEARLRDPAPFGFFSLANLFASLLIVLAFAAAGLAGDKIRAAAASLRDSKAARAKGEVDLPTLSAVIAAGGAALVAVVLLLTRSRGGIGGGLLAALAAVAVVLFGRRLRPHRRLILSIAAAAVLLGGGAMAACGLATGRLPTKTMTFRWFYWTGSAKIIAERPGLGVGGGNFPAAYLRHRPPAAEEAVKAPHNFVMHALAQFGLPGGAVYIVIVGAVVVGMSRPLPARRDPGAGDRVGRAPPSNAVVVIAAVTAAALAARLLLFDWFGDTALLVLEIVLPVTVLLVCLVAASWAGRALSAGPDAVWSLSLIALCCGAAAFVVHNLVTFSLWAPATGLVFWVAACACLGRAGGGRERKLLRSRWIVAAACVGAAVAAGGLVWRPAWAKAGHAAAAAQYLARGNADAAIRSAELAAEADPLDAIAAADAAKVILSLSPAAHDRAVLGLRRARDWAEQAIERDPARSAYHGLAARIAWYQAAPRDRLYVWARPAGKTGPLLRRLRAALLGQPNNPALLCRLAWLENLRGDARESLRLCRLALREDPNSALLNVHAGDVAAGLNLTEQAREAWKRAARLAPTGPAAGRALEHMARSVELDPMASRRRVEYARMLCAAGRPREAMKQIEAARKIDAALLPGSVYTFPPRELDQIALLKARAQVLME